VKNEISYVLFQGEKDIVHALGVGGGGEATLCGLAFNVAETERDQSSIGAMRSCGGPVTCPACTALVLHARRVQLPAPKVVSPIPCGCHCTGGCGDPYAACMYPCPKHIPF
jgi:hypothetical protein